MQEEGEKVINVQYSPMLNKYRETCFQGKTQETPSNAQNTSTNSTVSPVPLLINATNFITKRNEKADELEAKLQHVRDKYAITSGKDLNLSTAVAKKVLKKDEKLNKKLGKLDSKDAIIQQYRQGKISYKDADNYIEQLDTTYNAITKTIINVTTGVFAMSAGIAMKAKEAKNPQIFVATILTGILAKVGLSIFERSQNNIKKDEFDIKQIAKDAVSGAINGAFSGIYTGIGKTTQVTGAYVGKRVGFEFVKQTGMVGVQKAQRKNKQAF